jgi:heme/copper-type cytochrome/quinol oxidase subunit 3
LASGSFLASEVMLFGELFSAYIFLRLDAPPGMWPHGVLNVPVGTMNTAILIISSVTVVLAWVSLKMRLYRAVHAGDHLLLSNSGTNSRRSTITLALTLSQTRFHMLSPR